MFTGNLKFDMIAEGSPLGKNCSLELTYAFNVSICIVPFGLLGVRVVVMIVPIPGHGSLFTYKEI